jgi:hypothetical protein
LKAHEESERLNLFFRLGISLWLGLTLILSYEFYALNYKPGASVIKRIQPRVSVLRDTSTSPEPGRPISMFLGYAGLGIMILMNLYSMRKRYHLLGKVLPDIPRMLDFHIFCGLMGPTLIIFHSNFKVRGLVAISFWSMLVSASSGVIGRYFYTQIAKGQKDLRADVQKLHSDIVTFLKGKMPEFDPAPAFDYYVAASGLTGQPDSSGLVSALFNSIIGDFKLALAKPLRAIPNRAHHAFVQYASLKRKEGFVLHFQKMMGYWHTFHLPFAFFMYVAAFFHVIAALLLGVKK